MTDTPLVVGLGGTLRADSSTERALWQLELLATQLLTFARATATPAP